MLTFLEDFEPNDVAKFGGLSSMWNREWNKEWAWNEEWATKEHFLVLDLHMGHLSTNGNAHALSLMLLTLSSKVYTPKMAKCLEVPLFNPIPSSCCWISHSYTSSLCFSSL